MKKAFIIITAFCLILTTGCIKKPTTTITPNTSKLFFTGTFDGVSLDFKVPLVLNQRDFLPHLEMSEGSSGSSKPIGEMEMEQRLGVTKIDFSTGSVVEGCIVNLFSNFKPNFNSEAEDIWIKNMFQKKSYSFGTISALNNVKVNIFLKHNGIEYSTGGGSGNQTGSYFTINDVVTNDVTSTGKFVITSSFNCNLYDAQGNVKVLSGCQMKSIAALLD
jgi:hypothetical protein